MKLEDLILDVEQHIEINASIEKVFASLLHRLGEGNTQPGGTPMPMVIEPRAGGRWYRDRGEGVEHLWGFVQVIKAPTLLELSGPMFMSYPATNHLEVKLEETPKGTKATLRHRAVGMIDPMHRDGVGMGWKHYLDTMKTDCE